MQINRNILFFLVISNLFLLGFSSYLLLKEDVIRDARRAFDNAVFQPFKEGIKKLLGVEDPVEKNNIALNKKNNIVLNKDDIITTHYYDIKIEQYIIPSDDPATALFGGAINIINDNNILTALNNGELLTFNLIDKTFSKINANIKDNYFSIRDIEISYKDNHLLLLAMKEKNDCVSLVFDKYEYQFDNKMFEINNRQNIWSSELVCGIPDLQANSGGRIIIKDDHYFISTGTMGAGNSGIVKNNQSKNSSFGKIIKIDFNGNSEIYTIGHKNPQGLFVSKKNNLIISTEHGPAGGDEVNIIHKNNNYGFPCKTWGTHYTYLYEKTNKITDMWSSPKELETFLCNFDEHYTDPLFTWTPSIAISQGLEYQGDYFEKFTNNLLIGSLGGESLLRLDLSDGKRIINYEKIKINQRIRDLLETKKGKILLYTDSGNLLILSK
jgi:hypothetical protein